jgi:hypothetical protein
MNQWLSALHTSHPAPLEFLPETPLQLMPARPLLDELLGEIRPLPRGALFLGQAEDGLPVLLNLHDPTPGPVLILGEKGSGKTDLLRVIAQFIISTQTPGQTQFAVLTKRAEEWQERLADAPHCVGVFYSHEPAARQLLQSLDLWVSRTGAGRQAMLLLIDGLEAVLAWDESTLHCLRQILTYGPDRRVWPIATSRPLRDAGRDEWTSLFRSRITANDGSLCPRFSLTKNGRQIDFRVPAPGF